MRVLVAVMVTKLSGHSGLTPVRSDERMGSGRMLGGRTVVIGMVGRLVGRLVGKLTVGRLVDTERIEVGTVGRALTVGSVGSVGSVGTETRGVEVTVRVGRDVTRLAGRTIAVFVGTGIGPRRELMMLKMAGIWGKGEYSVV